MAGLPDNIIKCKILPLLRYCTVRAGSTSGPYCGWCIVSGKCSARASCQGATTIPRSSATATPYWLHASTACPKISDPAPASFPVGKETKLTLAAAGLPAALTNYSYYCVIKKHNVAVPAVLASSKVACGTMAVPALSSVDHREVVDVTVTHAKTPSLAKVAPAIGGAVSTAVYACGALQYTGCTGCLASQYMCAWCPFEAACTPKQRAGDTFTPTQCSSKVNDSFSCASLSDQMHMVDVNTGASSAPPLVVKGNHFATQAGSSNTYKCLFSSRTFSFSAAVSTAAYIDAQTLSCPIPASLWSEQYMPSLRSNKGDLPLNLSVAMNDASTNPTVQASSVAVTLFNCSLLGTNARGEGDCGRCLRTANVKYGCGWCGDTSFCSVEAACPKAVRPGALQWSASLQDCPRPTIIAFEPRGGPLYGGTAVNIQGANLGRTRADIKFVTVAGLACTISSFDGQQGLLVVETPKSPAMLPRNGPVVVGLKLGADVQAQSAHSYQFAAPVVTSVAPTRTPAAGGSTITLTGKNLDIGTDVEVFTDGSTCIPVLGGRTDTQLACTTKAGVEATNVTSRRRQARSLTNPGTVCVRIDGMILEDKCAGAVGVTFNTVGNPAVTGTSTNTGPAAGGTTSVASGTNLHAAAHPFFTVDGANTSKTSCKPSKDGRQLSCVVPRWSAVGRGKENTISAKGHVVQFKYHFDDASTTSSFTYYPDPRVTGIVPMMGNTGDRVEIAGVGLTRAGVPKVYVGGVPAPVSISNNDLIIFGVPAQPGNETAANVSLVLGDWSMVYAAEHFVYTTVKDRVVIVNNTNFINNTIRGAAGADSGIGASIAGGVLGGIACLFLLVFVAYQYKAYQQRKALSSVLEKMNLLESQVVEVCKQGFAELQQRKKLSVESADTLLLQRSYNDFIQRALFTHPDTHPMPAPSLGPGFAEPINKFRQLLRSSHFLSNFVNAIEASVDAWTIKDKCYIAALLQVVYHDEADQGLALLFALLDAYFERPSAKKQPKLVLRRTESVAEKLLSCWLSCQMYGIVTEKVSRPLYELLNAFQVQAEKGPVDAVTGATMYTISSDNLLREHITFNKLIITAQLPSLPDQGIEQTTLQVEVIDTDTVSQCLNKIISKAKKYGQNVGMMDTGGLKLVENGYPESGRMLLDLDDSSVCDADAEVVRMNTLRHLGIHSKTTLRVIQHRGDDEVGQGKASSLAPRSRSDSLLGGLGRRTSKIIGYMLYTPWHLVKPSKNQGGNDIMPQEIFLTYMLTVKGIIQPYVNGLLSSVLDPDTVPDPVQAIFDYLDIKASHMGISDQQVVHIWKNNSVSLRFWINLVKNPDFLFDITPSASSTGNLSVIAQVVMDACSTAKQNLNPSSPANKLMYRAEVARYKKRVKKLYATTIDTSQTNTDTATYVPGNPHMLGQRNAPGDGERTTIYSTDASTLPPFTPDSAALALLTFVATHKSDIVGNLQRAGKKEYADQFALCCTLTSSESVSTSEVEQVKRRERPSGITGMTQERTLSVGSADLRSGYMDVANNRSSVELDADMFSMPPIESTPTSPTSPLASEDGFGFATEST